LYALLHLIAKQTKEQFGFSFLNDRLPELLVCYHQLFYYSCSDTLIRTKVPELVNYERCDCQFM
jgi:hypothetical protein